MKFNLNSFSDIQQQGGMYSTYRPEKIPITNALLGIVFFIISVGAYPAKLFFRENMGERAVRIIHPILYIIAFFYIFFYTGLFSILANGLISYGSLDNDIFSMSNIVLSIPFASLIYIFWITRKSWIYFKKNSLLKVDYQQRIHSLYRGNSKFFNHLVGQEYNGKTIKDYHIQLYFEPIITFYLGLSLIAFDITLGSALIIAATCLFIDEWQVIQKRRDLVLDTLDSEMDAIFISKMKAKFKEISEQDIDLNKLGVGLELKDLLLTTTKKKKNLISTSLPLLSSEEEVKPTPNESQTFDIIT